MNSVNVNEIKLTDNTLENIKIMAPYLDETSQNKVYGYMVGIVETLGREEKLDKSD